MRVRCFAALALFGILGLVFAIPPVINYQGKVTDTSGVALDGTYSMEFRIYNVPTGGTALWSETHSSVEVHKGLFDVLLGESVPLNLPFDEQYYLEIVVNGEVLSPRIPMASVGYAFRAANVDTVNWSSIQGVPAGFADGVDDVADADSVVGNEYNTGLSFDDGTNTLSITDGGGTLTTTIDNEADDLSDNSIDDLADVSTSGVVAGQVLKWNGSAWVPANDSVGSGSGSDNDWTGAGTGAMYATYTSDNVGIGTASPTHKLDVNGNIGIAAGGYLNFGSTDGASGYGIRDSAGVIQYKHAGGSWTKFPEPPPIPSGTEFWIRPTDSSFIRPYNNDKAKIYDSGQTFSFWYEGTNEKGAFFAGNDCGVIGHRASVSSSNTPTFSYDEYPFKDRGNDAAISSSDSVTYTGIYGYGSFYNGVTGISEWDCGVRGIGLATTEGTNSSWPVVGVMGEVLYSGSSNYGQQAVYGWNSCAPDSHANYGIGVLGRTSQDGTMSAGVVGVYTSSVGDLTTFATSTSYGMVGSKSYGGYFYRSGSDGASAYFETGAGEYGQGPKDLWEGSKWTSDSDDGVEGVTSNSYYYGVYYSGGLGGSGTKSAVIRTSSGPRAVYCQESPEVWFEDFGGGEIHNGMCRVDLRPDFAEIVTVDEDHPMRVFITPCGNMGNWWIEKDDKGFTLHAPDAPDGTQFDWRVAAKRKHFEDKRLELRIAAYNDPYLYPENMGAYPKEIYEKLKPNADEPYEVYWADAVAHFQPHQSSPYNYLLPKNWREIRRKAREEMWKYHSEIAPAWFNKQPPSSEPVRDKDELERQMKEEK